MSGTKVMGQVVEVENRHLFVWERTLEPRKKKHDLPRKQQGMAWHSVIYVALLLDVSDPTARSL